MIAPEPLQKGDTLGIVAPAGMLSDEKLFYSGLHVLREMGFEVKFPRDLWPGEQYLADSDVNRVEELHSLFTDPDVKGLVCMRGGYGCLRLLQLLDLKLIATNPKIFVGFSDITILQNYLYSKLGFISFHGPTLTSLCAASREALEKFQHSLLGHWAEEIKDKNILQIQGGTTVSAPVVGGNLASLVTLLGTKFDLDWSESILFLEDVNEPIYKVDRMLTQLGVAGKFDRVAGILLGDFSPPQGVDELGRIRYREQVWNRVLEICPNKQIPVWANFPAGHCSHNITFPIGVTATMDCSSCSLRFPPR